MIVVATTTLDCVDFGASNRFDVRCLAVRCREVSVIYERLKSLTKIFSNYTNCAMPAKVGDSGPQGLMPRISRPWAITFIECQGYGGWGWSGRCIKNGRSSTVFPLCHSFVYNGISICQRRNVFATRAGNLNLCMSIF